jgi:hypothetical protein
MTGKNESKYMANDMPAFLPNRIKKKTKASQGFFFVFGSLDPWVG